LKWTEDPFVQYVELDLPSKSREKREVIDNLAFPRFSTNIRYNLHCEGGDALDEDDFERAVSFLGDGPIAIINEGFLRYLTHEEKSILAENIKRTLERFGGYWITPDIDILDPRLKDPRLKSYNDQLQSELGMDVTPNLFESVFEARGFFESLGFAVEVHSLKEILADMFSPRRLDLPMNKVENFIGQKVAFVMQLA
jgi:O-methyltransferase involved in polyketide biosynthesis